MILNIALAAIGVAVGIIFGAIPGMTATMAVAVFLPMTYALELVPALYLLLGLYVGGISGGLVPAILINVPGTPSSVCTGFDGNPMARRGEGERALKIGITASLMGGMISLAVLAVLTPPLARMAIKFSAVEKFLIILFAMTVIAALSKGSMTKGIFAGMLGVLLSLVGELSMNNKMRMVPSFLKSELRAGFQLLPLLIGLFAIMQMFQEAEKGMKANAMDEFQKSRYGALEREDLAGKDLLFRDIATQGKMEGTRQKIKGAGKVVTGAVDAAAGVAELSGAASAVGAGLKVGNAVLKSGFAAANAVQKNRMVNKVVQQTTGLTDEKIKEFQKQAGIKSFSRAKQALMKSMGYESGARAELYADQTEKRGQYLAEMANSGMEGDKANQLVTGLGVKKGAAGYDAGEITKSLGHWKSRAAIAKGYNSIKKKAAQRRNQGATP